MNRILIQTATACFAALTSTASLWAQPVLVPPGASATRPAGNAASADTVYVIRRDSDPQAVQAAGALPEDAIEGRHKALAQHRLGDLAFRDGKMQEALAYYAPLTMDPYLTLQERQTIARVCEQLQRRDARRTAALQGEQTGNSSTRRPDPDQCLAEARRAFGMRDFDRAEALAHQAQQLGHTTYLPWSDTPAKLLRDVRDARRQLGLPGVELDASRGATQTVQAPGAGEAMRAGVPSGRFSEPARFNEPAPFTPEQPARIVVRQEGNPAARRSNDARDLLEQAHQLAEAGELARAKQLLRDAEALKPAIPWWEECTPEKVRLAIARAEQAAKTRPATASAPPSNDASPLAARPGAQFRSSGSDANVFAVEARTRVQSGPFSDAELHRLAEPQVAPSPSDTPTGRPWRLLEPRKPESEIIASAPPMAGLGNLNRPSLTRAETQSGQRRP